MPREGGPDEESRVSGYGHASSDADPDADGYGPGHHHVFAGGGGDGSPSAFSGSPFPPLTPETGGSAILLPAAALLLGSGILTYAILRRR